MDYIVQHAVDNVWCSPRQDRSYRMRPKRISRVGGEVVQIESDWIDVNLPDSRNYYHVYQIGGLYPDFLGLFPVQNKWVSLTEICNKMGMIAEMYSINGFMTAKSETYYMVTRANNLILATRKRDNKLGIKYDLEDLFFRVYTNAFFQSQRSNDRPERVVTKGYVPALMEDILRIQQEYLTYKNKTVGYAWAIINGKFAETISPLNCKIGDLVDWVYDGSVQKVVEYEISKLPGFDSTLDTQRKYLLHYPGTGTRIDYKDDLELFMIERPAVGSTTGITYHQNTEKALRMVTHRDYAISSQVMDAFVDGHPTWTDKRKLRILMLVRDSGYNRPLTFENNRIHELYKLNDNQILPAMVGEYAAVPNWNAAVLEASNYPKVMGKQYYSDFTRQEVQDMYGYNAISKIVGDTPLRVSVVNGARVIKLPVTYQARATAFEYDERGVLLGWFFHTNSSAYGVTQPTTALVEFFVGYGNQFLDEVYDQKTSVIDPTFNYRMYVCDKVDGVAQGNWRDVTDTGQYAIQNGVLTWLINMVNFSTLVRSDKQGISSPVTLTLVEGIMEFTMSKFVTKNGVTQSEAFDVPMGELDLIMNGRSLIENIDYIVKFPKVIFFNKKYLYEPQTTNQQIAFRYMGFCKKDLTMENNVDQGFLKWELLSRNATFNIRDDRVLRIIFDGRVCHRDDLKFSESDQAYVFPNIYNGLPYQVRDAMVPMRPYTNGDSYKLREASRVIDKAVSEYLSMALPEPVQTVPNVINERYPIYSPFMCRVIYQLLAGVIQIDESMVQYTPEYVRSKCQAYEYILPFDPTQDANTIDPDFVIIHPVFHNNVMKVTVSQFNFLQQVNITYTGNKLVLNHFLQLA